MIPTFLSCLLAASLLTCAAGAEFRVNARTSLDQADPAIAMDSGGRFVVVWSSYFGTAGRSNDILGRIFDASCTPLSDEFQVNATTPGNQKEPDVAMDAEGNFVVVWQGPGDDEEDIFARRFDRNGQAIADEFRVNTVTGDKQLNPRVAMNARGDSAIVWESENVPEPNKTAICAQLYDSFGAAIGGEFVVNSEPAVCRYPDVAIDPNGDVAVVWLWDRSSKSILARLFYADETPRTERFEVSTTGFSSLTSPSIAMNDTGHFVVTWDGHPHLASQDDIHARMFDANGIAAEEQFRVNTDTPGPQQYPRAAANSAGEFVIVWDSEPDPPESGKDIFAQRYDDAGAPFGHQFRINTYTTDDQRYPSVALGSKDQFVTVWQSREQDGSGWGIFGTMGLLSDPADLTGDGLVNFLDFCLLAQQWRRTQEPLTTDLSGDGKIDERDLAFLCQHWLTP
ncbi:MAG: hypothetical protein JSU70_01205 [Phycisphaerales bacterium]|nr:MAG: hypothetical protein JSU70_01205 [Phycisphaerales bacterium]